MNQGIPWIGGDVDTYVVYVIFVLDFQSHCGLRTENDIPARIQVYGALEESLFQYT